MTIKLATHVSLTITSDAKAFQPCKQQQIASGNELFISDSLEFNLLIVLK